MAAAVNLDVAACARKTGGSQVFLQSAEYPGVDTVDLNDLEKREEEEGTSAALIKGICARCKQLGYQVGGFQAYTMTKVLKGSGLSSSAAFEVLVVTVISHLLRGKCLFRETLRPAGSNGKLCGRVHLH